MRILVEPHPSARLAAFTTRFPEPLGVLLSPSEARALLRPVADPPLQRSEAVRQAVRDMLRHGGYKPTGRGKPASEYLVRAAENGTLESINTAVDICNAVSLHSGLPISVVDYDLIRPPLHIAIAGQDARYVFNPSGQEIDVAGLLCLFDAAGPCGNAVRDAQRTKTRPDTVGTVSIIWGVAGEEDRLARTEEWYRRLLHDAGATTATVELVTG
jgi:DNA/RNA-binding domain of Phe-tRNA-synthetase-like protein